MRIELTQEVAAAPAAVWPLLTDPAEMNRWSLARIDPVSPGDGGRCDTVGTWRRVTVRNPLGAQRLDEAVVAVDAPRRFEYRVVPDAMITGHRGVITLDPTPAGTLVRWTVDLHLAFPVMERAAVRVVRPQLAESLAAMARCARGAPERAPWPDPFVDDGDEEALLREARAVLEGQRAVAAELEAADDPRRWFTRLYAFTTEAILGAHARGDVAHGRWLLRLVPRFHAYYFDNLARARGAGEGSPEPHWQRAFRAMEEGPPRARFVAGLRAAVQAHIEDDLPRALADVYRGHYRGRCDYGRFQGDYLMLQRALEEPAVPFLPTVPRALLPWGFRVAERVTPESIRRFVRIRDEYDVPARHREAFARGAALAAAAG